MKAITKLFLVIFAAITCFGCEKIENDNNKGQNTQEDFYYVRFEATSSYYYIYGVSLSLTGCESFRIIVEGKTCSEIIGPAHKGAVAKMNVSMVSGSCDNTAIYVSKNNGPFALKKIGSGNLSYTIDF
ncbi:MAG: hypothetical protein J6K57_05585 [Alistipes sp.]|nr:hypothetical protein [Alistipes sp.]